MKNLTSISHEQLYKKSNKDKNYLQCGEMNVDMDVDE